MEVKYKRAYRRKNGKLVKAHRQRYGTYKRWKKLVNMTPSELRKFKKSKEGMMAGLTRQKARKLGIKSGQQSADWILKMKPKGKTYKQAEENWTPEMWRWAGRQVSFNSRMLGNRGPLYDKKGNKTRKHLSLLIWGHDPKRRR